MIDRTLKVGEKVTAEEVRGHSLIPVDKVNPMPKGTVMRVNAMDLGRDGYIFLHFGGSTGPMYKDRNENEISNDCIVNAIFKPK